MKLIDYCQEHQIPFIYLNISYITTADGKTKKQISRLPKGYMTMDYATAMKQPKPANATHINIILRNSAHRKLVVIDTDAPDAYTYITGIETLSQTAITANNARPGHAHFYYEVPTLPAKKIIKTASNMDIDLIIDNIFEKVDAEFTRLPAQIELAEIHQIFGDRMTSRTTNEPSSASIPSNQAANLATTTNTEIPILPPQKIPNTTETNTTENHPIDNVSIELIGKMVNGLNPEEYKSYPMWIKLCYCLYNLAELDLANKDKYFDILNNFLKQNANYNEVENFKFFYQTTKKPDVPDKITIKTLYYWLRTQNRKLYDELFIKIDLVKDGVIDPVYFYDKYKKSYDCAKAYFEQVYFKLNTPACFCKYDTTTAAYTFITDKELFHITKNFYIDAPKIPDKKLQFINLWLSDPAIKFYDNMKLVPPPLECGARTLNLFTGFAADKLTPRPIVLIDIIINHINILCEDNPIYAEYVLNFLAHIIQRPAELTRTALVFKGAQGAGKGIFFNWFGKHIIGSKYYYMTADPANITVYNDHLNGKILINLDEARAADTYAAASQLKNKITEPTITLQNKYVKPFTVENYGRYVFFSNQDNPVKVEDTDRRYVIFKTSEKYARLTPEDPVKIQYFTQLKAALADPNVIYSFMQFLRARDIENINWEDRPMTESYVISRELNIPIFAEFLEKYCFETPGVEFTNGLNQTTKTQFFAEFNRFLERTRNSNMVMKERTFSIECKKHKFILYKQRYSDRTRYLEINKNGAFEYLKKNNYLQHSSEDYNM